MFPKICAMVKVVAFFLGMVIPPLIGILIIGIPVVPHEAVPEVSKK